MSIRSRLFFIYVALSVIYVIILLVPHRVSGSYHLSPLHYRLLSLTIILPLLAIWYTAFYGYAKLRRYARLIAPSSDGRPVAWIAHGLLLLAVGLPVNSIASASLQAVSQHWPHFTAAATIIRDYVSLVIPLASFLLISYGADGLGALSKHRPRMRSYHLVIIAYVIIAVLYCYATATSASLRDTYHLPPWLVMVSIVAPYLYTWFIGLQAAYDIHLYNRNAPGKLYRQTWDLLASGLGWIIIIQIVIQYMATITAGLASLRLARLLFIIYVLLASLAVGFLLVAVGAKRLQKIEEV